MSAAPTLLNQLNTLQTTRHRLRSLRDGHSAGKEINIILQYGSNQNKMEIHPGLKAVLDNILFWQRYKNIVANNHDFTHRFSSYNNDKVGELIESLGYSVSYNKSENFFKLIEKIPPFQFQFNMMLKSGIIELIWAVRQNDQKMPLGVGSWGSIADFLSSEEKIKNPIFTSYDDLRSILKEAFAIYEDFKRELLNQSISFGNLVYAG